MAVNDSFTQQDALNLTLSLQKFDPAAQKIFVKLIVENVGSHSLILPHLTNGVLERYGVWGGWTIFVERCYPLEIFVYNLEEHLPLTTADIIELAPGESFSTIIDLAPIQTYRFANEKERNITSFKLIDTEGQYQAVVGFSFSEGIATQHLKNFLWEGSVQSNTISFSVIYNKRRMYFPSEHNVVFSPQKDYSIINIEHEEGVSETQYTLYLHDIDTDERNKLYSYNEHVEVLWSPKGSKLLINDHDCRNGYSFPFVFDVGRKNLINVTEFFQDYISKTQDIFCGDNHFMIIANEWLNEEKIKISVHGYHESKNTSFIYWYEYNLSKGTFKELDLNSNYKNPVKSK